MKHSCGALFYTYNTDRELGIILGEEGYEWLPFKGCPKDDETYEQTAIREIFEETGGLIRLNSIKLKHYFTSKHKHYHIGLVYVPYETIYYFNRRRHLETRPDFTEKKELKFFPLSSIKNNLSIHNLTLASIRFYWNDLLAYSVGVQPVVSKEGERIRKHSVCVRLAKENFDNINNPFHNEKIRNNRYGDFGKSRKRFRHTEISWRKV